MTEFDKKGYYATILITAAVPADTGWTDGFKESAIELMNKADSYGFFENARILPQLDVGKPHFLILVDSSDALEERDFDSNMENLRSYTRLLLDELVDTPLVASVALWHLESDRADYEKIVCRLRNEDDGRN